MFLNIRLDHVELRRIAKARNREHWVCFDCRKMFKRPARPENVASGPLTSACPYRCPQCGESMRDMGVYFEPPRRRDISGWARMKLLAEFGMGFYTEGGKSYIDRELVGIPPVSPNALRRRLSHDRACFAVWTLRRDAKYLRDLRKQKAAIRRMDR